jgi:ectonucleotide pyrophosphatase/phosphodiesterase family protein 5
MKIKISLLLIILSLSLNASDRPYVLLISFDGFRWDYVSRGITPALSKTAEDGVHALTLRPTFPTKTFPNHYSIITGLHPENHGLIANSFINPETGNWYSLGDSNAVKDTNWYQGEPFWETAERNNIKTASMFWPGSEQKGKFKHPTYVKKYDHNMPYIDRVDTVISWFKKPIKTRPQFVTLYFHDTDSYGHEYGPNSPEINESIKRMDSVFNYLVDQLKEINFYDSLNIIALSDHGMNATSPSRAINVADILSEFDVDIFDSGPVLRVHPLKSEVDSVYNKLKTNESHFRVYRKEELNNHFNYSNHEFIPPLIVVADMGWSLINKQGKEYRYGLGNHGYEKDHLDMHGLFIAKGPAFKAGYKTGTIWNIDIYPLLSEIFNLPQNSQIDGDINRIAFLLKGN